MKAGSWKQNIVSIKFLVKSQEYIHNNNEIQSYLEFTGFQKSESDNYQEFKYIKILPKNNNSSKNYDFVSDIKPRNKNILNPRLNCLSKEADQALKMGNKNVYDAIKFYLNTVFEEKLETNFTCNNIQVLGSGAEGVCFLINNKVIKVYKDKYFYQKNKLDNNHEPDS